MLGAFCESGLESHVLHDAGYVVVEYELRVGDHLGVLAELGLYQAVEVVDLADELFRVFGGSHTVGVCSAEEFHFACSGEFLEELMEIGSRLLYLLYGGA